MNFRNIIAVIAGLIIGSVVNMGILEIGTMLIPNPEGFDNSSMDALKASIELLNPIHFIPVFLAHGLGTLVGAFAASKIAKTQQFVFALVIGGWFLLGGIVMAFIVPSPIGFIVVDLAFAYIPMAWIGWKLAGAMDKKTLNL